MLQTNPYVLAFGDSLTAGYGLSRHEALPARLQALLRDQRPEAVVQNAGVSGDTTASALNRLSRLLSSLSRKPDLALVELGANDLIRRINPVQTRANLDAILRGFARCEIPVLLLSLTPPVFLGDLVSAYAGMYEELGEAHNVPVHPFFPPGVLGHHAHVLRDRLHPNALAIGKVARALLPALERGLVAGNATLPNRRHL